MKLPRKAPRHPVIKAESFALPLVFFFVYFCFVLFYIDPGLIYFFNGIHKFSYTIEFSREFAASVATVPGGCTKLAVAIFVEACYWPWLGSLLITAAALVLFAGCKTFCKNAGIRAPAFLFYAPAALTVPIVAQYYVQYFPALLAMIGSTWLCVLYQSFQRPTLAGRTAGNIAVLVACSLVSFYLFSMAGLLFIVLALTHAALSGKKLMHAGFAAGAVAAVLVLSLKMLFFPFDRIFNFAEMLDISKPLVYLYVFLPALAMLFKGTTLGLLHRTKPHETAISPKKMVLRTLGRVVPSLALLAAAFTVTLGDWATINVAALGRVIRETRQEHWSTVLDMRTSPVFLGFPSVHSRTQMMASHALYRALFHLGRLGSDMLTFPQACDPEPLLLYKSAWNIYFPAWALGIDAATDLGSLNFAEKLSGEAMENMGPLPYFCYRRALIQIAKGNKDLAAVYLRKLQRMPHYGQRARLQLEAIASVGSGPDALAPPAAADLVFERTSEEDVLLDLLKTNPGNRMAFEYLMAYYLLSRRPDKLAGQLYRLDDFGSTEIPRLYEEAFAIYQGISPDSAAMVRLPKCGMGRAAFDRRDSFLHALDVYGEQAPKALLVDFGSTYFYLYTFGVIPGGVR
jgi:hypothetical protein